MGDPQNGWFRRENPHLKWMIWGYPHSWNPPYVSYCFFGACLECRSSIELVSAPEALQCLPGIPAKAPLTLPEAKMAAAMQRDSSHRSNAYQRWLTGMISF